MLQVRAKDAGMTLIEYLIVCGLGQEIVHMDGLDEILSELKAQGRNLNQLTTLANMADSPFSAVMNSLTSTPISAQQQTN